MNFYLTMTLFLEIMKCQFLSETVNEKVVFFSIGICYCRIPGSPHHAEPPVQDTDQAMDAQGRLALSVRLWDPGHRAVPGEPGPPVLTPCSPGQFSTWGCWTNTSRQGVLNTTSFGKTFWSLWAKVFLKYFPIPWTQTGVLCAEVWETPSRGALGISGWNDPAVPTQTQWAPRGVCVTSAFTERSHAFLLDFSGMFSKCHLFFSLIEKICMYLFQYMENTEVYRRK